MIRWFHKVLKSKFVILNDKLFDLHCYYTTRKLWVTLRGNLYILTNLSDPIRVNIKRNKYNSHSYYIRILRHFDVSDSVYDQLPEQFLNKLLSIIKLILQEQKMNETVYL